MATEIDGCLGIDFLFLGIVSLGDGTLHHHGALGRGEVEESCPRIVLLHVVGPGRTTGCYLRKRTAILHRQALHQLRSLFHDGEVGGEVGVEYRIGAEHPQGGVHLAGHDGARFLAEGLADGNACGGSHLNNDVLAFGPDGIEELVGFVIFIDGTDRTVGRTLTAFDAGAFVQRAPPAGCITVS